MLIFTLRRVIGFLDFLRPCYSLPWIFCGRVKGFLEFLVAVLWAALLLHFCCGRVIGFLDFLPILVWPCYRLP